MPPAVTESHGPHHTNGNNSGGGHEGHMMMVSGLRMPLNVFTVNLLMWQMTLYPPLAARSL